MSDYAARMGTAAWLILIALLAGSCSAPPEEAPGEARAASPAPADEATVNKASAAPAETPIDVPPSRAQDSPLVVFLGDSLTAGLGVGEAEAFPEQVRLRLAAAGTVIRVVNAGVSGDTTAGGRARLAWVLRQKPDVLVVGLGANDGLRGLELEETEANLRAIVAGAREAGARVLLLGMLLPPNYGPDYTSAFQAIFPRLADELGVRLVPFLLEGVAARPGLNQADGIHPTAEGHQLMAGNVAPLLEKILESGS